MEAFAPGVEVLEKEALAVIEAAGTSFSGMVCQAERGPDNVVTFLSNFDQYKRRYGGYGGFLGYPMAEDYFDQEGAGLYFIRAVGEGAAQANFNSFISARSLEYSESISGMTLVSGEPVVIQFSSDIPDGILKDGDQVWLQDISGGDSEDLNDNYWTVTRDPDNDDTISLDGTDSDDYTGYTSGGDGFFGIPAGNFLASSVGQWGNNTLITTNKWVANPATGWKNIVPLAIKDIDISGGAGNPVILEFNDDLEIPQSFEKVNMWLTGQGALTGTPDLRGKWEAKLIPGEPTKVELDGTDAGNYAGGPYVADSESATHPTSTLSFDGLPPQLELGDGFYLFQNATATRTGFGFILDIDVATQKATIFGDWESWDDVSAIDISAGAGNEVEVTFSGDHDLRTGDYIYLSGSAGIVDSGPGTTDLAGKYQVGRVSDTIVVLADTDQGDWTGAYTGGDVAFNPYFDDTSSIYCNTTHKSKTVTTEFYNGGTTLKVASNAGISKGALLFFWDQLTGAIGQVKVNSINGSILNVTLNFSNDIFDALGVPADTNIVSMNFNVLHNVDGETTIFEFLNLESDCPADYIVDRLAESEFLRFDPNDAFAIPPGIPTSLFFPGAYDIEQNMIRGLDGSAATNQDYLGTNTSKLYTHGMQLFDSVGVLPQFAIPGQGVTVQKGADTYAKSREDTVFIGDVPLAEDTLEEVLNYRNVTLNIQSSYSTLTFPWLKKQDPDTAEAEIITPPSAKALGVMSYTSQTRGTQKPPANEQINNIIDVNTVVTKQEHGFMNAAGINVITNEPGRGIRLMGARTLWGVADRKQYLNVRRILNAVKIGLKEFGETIVFEANDDLLWKDIQAQGTKYLETLWKLGWFYPRLDPTQAFFFRCDSTTNREDLRLAGKVRSVVGINPVLPGELIIFEVTLWDGGAIVTEI